VLKVGDLSLIGMGAVVGEGAVVEGGSLVAAGAVVAPHTVVKAGELWGGSPAAKLRDLKVEGQSVNLLFGLWLVLCQSSPWWFKCCSLFCVKKT
jgi:tetrahydrodipicolinate N-succinyltransferase